MKIPDIEIIKNIEGSVFGGGFYKIIDKDYILNHRQYRQSVLLNQKRKFDFSITNFYNGMHYYIRIELEQDPLLFLDNNEYCWSCNDLYNHDLLFERFKDLPMDVIQDIMQWDGTVLRESDLIDANSKYLSKPFELTYEEKKEDNRIFLPERVIEALNHFKKYLNPDFEINDLQFDNAMSDMKYDIEHR